MQTLTFTSSAGSLELGSSPPYIMHSFEGAGGLETEIQTVRAPYQDGKTYLDTLAEMREITFQVALLADTQAELYERMRELSSIFNPKLGQCSLVYVNDYHTREIACYVDRAPVFPIGDEHRGPGFQNCLIQLLATDPFWLDEYQTTEVLAAVTPCLEFPLEISEEGVELGSHSGGIIVIDNDGDVEAPLTFEFAGPVTDPKILNETTGEYIELIYPLLLGETMRITTAFGQKTAVIIDELGAETSAFQYLNLASTFFQLQRGENTLIFTASAGSDKAEITIRYRKRYVGV